MAPPLEEHRPWLTRSSDPGVLLVRNDPRYLGAPTLAPQEPKLEKSTDPAPKEQIASRGAPNLAPEKPKQMATWPAFGQNSYVTPAVSGIPNTLRGD